MRHKRGGAYAPIDNRTEGRTQEPMPKGRVILLAVRIFLFVLVQVSVVPRIGFFGAVPDILLAYLVTTAVTGRGVRRWRAVAVSGLFVGFLVDAIGGVGVGFSALFYVLVGAVSSVLVRQGFRNFFESLLCFYAVLIPAALLGAGVTLLTVLLSRHAGFSFLVCLRGTLVPEFFGTLLYALPIFLLFRERGRA